MVDLNFSVKNLKKYDVNSKTDCFITVYEFNPELNDRQMDFVGKTEVQPDNLDPEFIERIPIEYKFS